MALFPHLLEGLSILEITTLWDTDSTSSLIELFALLGKDRVEENIGKCLKNVSLKIEEDNKKYPIIIVYDWDINNMSKVYCKEIRRGQNLFYLNINYQ